MAVVTFSPKSRQDLFDIGDYIARDDLAPGLRMAALDRYVIFFRVIDGVVRIERVLHGARNLPVVLGQPAEAT